MVFRSAVIFPFWQILSQNSRLLMWWEQTEKNRMAVRQYFIEIFPFISQNLMPFYYRKKRHVHFLNYDDLSFVSEKAPRHLMDFTYGNHLRIRKKIHWSFGIIQNLIFFRYFHGFWRLIINGGKAVAAIFDGARETWKELYWPSPWNV